jgi:hypothetical protein
MVLLDGGGWTSRATSASFPNAFVVRCRVRANGCNLMIGQGVQGPQVCPDPGRQPVPSNPILAA